MKRILCLFLLLSLLLSLCACATEQEESTAVLTLEETSPLDTAPTKEPVATKETVEEKPKVEFHHVVEDPLTQAKLDAIPIANASMTTDELRDICIRYIKLSVSFQWIPDGDMTLGSDGDSFRSFTKGKLEGGIPYINTASGNLYRILEYYDQETGILTTSYLGRNPLLFGTACSGTTGWAWSRVVNSAVITWTHSLNAAHGLVPVGPYTYDQSLEKIWTEVNGQRIYHYSNKDICKKNGKQVMFQSYANTLPADCFGSNGHVRMSTEVAHVEYQADGVTIDGKKSYIMLAEQGLYHTAEHHRRYTSDGTMYLIRGNDGRAFTFDELYTDGYIPHTFKEFIGQDPVEKGEVTIEHSGPTVSDKDLAKGDLVANYPISDIFVNVKDKDGKVVLPYVKRASNHFTKKFSMAKAMPISYLSKYEDGTYTLELLVQLSNGELVNVYTGTIVDG